ncbi:MAG: class I mannose-6-phosphate isomerase [Ruminococcus sp.]|jgi:mannose-6-phosphate isomerase|nr:class I mannose-6-phosphate isomerase [Ruminococcus sp.]
MNNVYFVGSNKLYPIKLQPVFKDYIWGGSRLCDIFHKKSDLSHIAESWELSTQAESCCKVSNGVHAGKLLSDIFNIDRERILGKNCNRFKDFPVLIKFIDAGENLSLQVHPDDTYAKFNFGSYGKSEMWYVCDALPGAKIILGFKRVITKNEFIKHITENTLAEVIREIPVRKGDVFFVKSGTLHAIGKGVLIAEIQQNSDLTFRVHDYGRVDKDGLPRELHIDDALMVTDLKPSAGDLRGTNIHNRDGSTLLIEHDCFIVYKIDIKGSYIINVGSDSFCSLLVTDGAGILVYNEDGKKREMALLCGDSLFIPAGFGKFEIRGNCTILKTLVGEKQK